MRRILVPVDGSRQSLDALGHALETFPDDEIVVLHALNFVEVVASESSANQARERANEIFREVRTLADEYDHTVETETTEGDPGRAIVAYAADRDIDQIVIGSTGRTGLDRLLLGSVAELVARRAPVPVTIVR
nr:universal stress protein [Haloterrigena salifodinae]